MFNYEQQVTAKGAGLLTTNSEKAIGPKQTSYNELRHSGAGYALVDFYDQVAREKDLTVEREDLQYVAMEAANKAANWSLNELRRTLPAQPGFERSDAIYSFSKHRRAKLGASGLTLILLAKIEATMPGSIKTKDMKALANFIVAMQTESGQFWSFYVDGDGPSHKPNRSLYYPGEAMLGLMYFYNLFPDPMYLETTTSGIISLARERAAQPMSDIPIDHWLLIAVREWVPAHRRSDRYNPKVEQEVMTSIERIVNATLCQMPLHTMGSAPVATRMEGMQATMFYLPSLQGDTCTPYKTMVQKSISHGVNLLLDSQIRPLNNEYLAGGWLGSVKPIAELQKSKRLNVRIDFPQHALSAIVRHWQLIDAERLNCQEGVSDDTFATLLAAHATTCNAAPTKSRPLERPRPR
ncbi:hypothetical protein SARC_05838 [Sphaeroforma arctica JP610]|uniref:Uncharacterized protein n=1 Tax=Sphaeroforma arctica JP610 TaxID=667725 RepID=A0A0L0FYF2_9EUKA|nr:hypothetical protein SARC_05838 [Sphaeroforma arctica JP610]KNC81865.1 hypothetical protein SARC_05838 [Sphaeroforma arctica JP610]|eukprot:XP_014155767.1 hypothetical protein SARC_05838 [Sphaeroforma arctica JP610]